MKKELSLNLTSSNITTKVHFGNDLLHNERCVSILKSLGCRLAVIADSNVKTLFVDGWLEFLKKQGLNVLGLTFSAGEESKTREEKTSLEDKLFANNFGKDTAIVAFGGGVTTDLAGYVASTFCRGVPFLCIPTTLLCMVDAAIGGKNGVNTPFGKNLVGTFYPSEHIFIDAAFLSSLPDREWKNGIAEIIKYGLIKSDKLFQRLLTNNAKWMTRDSAFVEELVHESIFIKKEIVEKDFKESGYRKILNFGHTVAHALELLEKYKISHGEAVAIGILAASFLSFRLNMLSFEDYRKIETVLKLYNLPTSIPSGISHESLIKSMLLDKKTKNSSPRFVLLKSLGSVADFDGHYCTDVDETILNEFISRGRP